MHAVSEMVRGKSEGNVNNYRGVTLSPVISKLLDVVLLSLCSDALETDFFNLVLKTRLVPLMPFLL